MKQKREEIEPLQIELEQFDNDVGNVSPSKSVGSTNRRKSAGLLVFLLVLICVVLSVSVVSYLISDTDQNADLIGVEVDDKENKGDDTEDKKIEAATGDANQNASSHFISPKVTVKMTDGIMYQTIGDQMIHNKTHFTQGLTYSKHSDMLFESNGLYSRSNVCKIDPHTGKAIKCVNMENKYFAEGMQVYGNPGDEKLIQITWKSQDGFIYNAETLEVIRSFKFSTARNEGWGICYDEKNHEFIVSDGSSYLHFWDADSLEEKRRVEVTRQNGSSASHINELEFANGIILANVWFEDVILVIDPMSGECLSEYDMSQLWPRQDRVHDGADVLNGISISKEEGVFYITGKMWNRMFRLKFDGL